jgi:nucleotide-binding universal stress UspA family protein
MREGGIPVLLSGAPYRPVRTIVAGCGGGLRTERAVGAMARLSLWKEAPRGILLAVNDAPEGGQERIAAPRQILADAGYPPWEEKVLPGPRATTFLSFCDSVDADVVILGGWGEHRWDDLLGLSVTGRLLEDGRRHLFLYM